MHLCGTASVWVPQHLSSPALGWTTTKQAYCAHNKCIRVVCMISKESRVQDTVLHGALCTPTVIISVCPARFSPMSLWQVVYVIYSTKKAAINNHDLRESQPYNSSPVWGPWGEMKALPIIPQCDPESPQLDLPKPLAAVESYIWLPWKKQLINCSNEGLSNKEQGRKMERLQGG